jgi:hypothetical protein
MKESLQKPQCITFNPVNLMTSREIINYFAFIQLSLYALHNVVLISKL